MFTPRVSRLAVAGVMTGALGCAAGCGVGSGGKAEAPGPDSTSTRSVHSPGPVRTVIRDYPTYAIGQPGEVRSPAQHALLRVTPAKPSVSTTRLSPSYGYGPSRGHYVTFRLRIANAGRVPVSIDRSDFFVRTKGLGKTHTDDGNAPYSGSGSQLTNTQLLPGDSVRNNLTFDVRHPSGTLFYAPDGHVALAWRF